MEINFEAVIKTNDFEVDMTPGLETLHGISEITRHTAEAVLMEENKQRLYTKSKVRTLMRKNFNSSYGQKFALIIEDTDAQKRLTSIGKKTFIEILSYVINESTYQKTDDVSKKALKEIKKLGMKIPPLIDQIKKSPIRNAHASIQKIGIETHLRTSTKNKYCIAKFCEESLENTKAKINKKEVALTATVHRFNNMTGNGRLKPTDSDETFAFGFLSPMKEVPLQTQRRFSGNLDDNTGIALDYQQPIRIIAQTIRRKDGVVLKYLVVRNEN